MTSPTLVIHPSLFVFGVSEKPHVFPPDMLGVVLGLLVLGELLGVLLPPPEWVGLGELEWPVVVGTQQVAASEVPHDAPTQYVVAAAAIKSPV